MQFLMGVSKGTRLQRAVASYERSGPVQLRGALISPRLLRRPGARSWPRPLLFREGTPSRQLR